MTMPSERARSILRTREFLRDLLDRKKTPRVPMEIRKMAVSLLRHYPSAHYIKMAGDKAPDVFQLTNEEVEMEYQRLRDSFGQQRKKDDN